MAGRRGHGEGSVYQLKDGTWKASISTGRKADGRLERIERRAKSKSDARKKLRELQQRQEAGEPALDRRTTVGQWLTRWLAEILPETVAPSTAENYGILARVHILPALGQTKLADLSAFQIDRFLAERSHSGKSPNTVRLIKATLHRCLGDAERHGLIQTNPATRAKSIRVPQPSRRAMTPEQLQLLLKSVRYDDMGPPTARFIGYKELWQVIATYGLRIGEACGIGWEDIDQGGAIIHLRHDVERRRVRDENGAGREVLVLGELKTDRSRRPLPLVPTIRDALERRRLQQADAKRRVGETWKDSGRIFTSPTGDLLNPLTASRAFTRHAERAGLGKWTVHELRHSAVAIMLSQGVPLHTVSRVVGHSSITVTADVYGHLDAEGRLAAIQASETAWQVDKAEAPPDNDLES